MKKIYLSVFTFCLLILGVQNATASTTGSVGSPNVTKDKTEVIVRFGFSETGDDTSSQDNRFRTRIHIDHGFSDFYAARLIVSQDKRKGDSYEHDSLTFENRFHILKAKQHGFDFGARASYKLKDGDKKADSLGFGLYELIPLDDYELRANQIFAYEVGEESEDGIDAALRFQATKKMNGSFKVGLESFHEFGNLSDLSGYSDQSHTFGPVVKGKLPYNLKFETGYRAGISKSAPDHNFKFFISHSF